MFAIRLPLCYDSLMEDLKKNDIYTVTIEDYSSDASGICRINGRVVFVPKAIPGEEWEIRIVKVRHDCAYARGERLLKASLARIVSACPYFGLCGGCDTQHISYEEELRFKLGLVNSALRRIGKQSVQATEIIGSDPRCIEHKEIRFVYPSELAAFELCPADITVAEKIISEAHLF